MARQPVLPEAPSQLGSVPQAWRARGRAWLRAAATPVVREPWALSGSATINAQTWFSRSPLRPTAGWVVIAALLMTGWPMLPVPVVWRDLALILLLADPLWGSIWRLAAGRVELLPLRERELSRDVWLPYLQPGSPAARLLGRDDHGVLHLILRVVVPTVALAGAIAWVLGPTALLLTALVAGAGVVGWIVRHSAGTIPALLHSVVTVTLPWLLGLLLLGFSPNSQSWPAAIALMILWTVHNWGEGRYLRAPGDRLGIALLALGDIGIGLLLVVSRAPLALAALAVIWLALWLLIFQGRALRRLNFWWLVAMLISAVAVGQAV